MGTDNHARSHAAAKSPIRITYADSGSVTNRLAVNIDIPSTAIEIPGCYDVMPLSFSNDSISRVRSTSKVSAAAPLVDAFIWLQRIVAIALA